jgi:hypothetical protein
MVTNVPMYALKAALKGASGIMSYPSPNSHAMAHSRDTTAAWQSMPCLKAQCSISSHCQRLVESKYTVPSFHVPNAVLNDKKKCNVCPSVERLITLDA